MAKQPLLYSATGQCCELDEPYQAPVGYFDQPFYYVYDANILPDDQDRRFANIKTFTGSDFILRRVGGIDRVCTSFQLRDVLSRQIFNEPAFSTFRDFPLIPEALYPGGTGITFDLFDVQKAVNGSGELLSQIVFQGVRRYKGYRRPPSYPYWEDEWKYPLDITVNFGVGETHIFSQNILDCDFELLRITAVAINAPGASPNVSPSGVFKLQLFDQVNETVFSLPVIDDLFLNNSANYLGIVPVPGIVYRIGQQIKVELTSLCALGECSVEVQLVFHGVRRRPCWG